MKSGKASDTVLRLSVLSVIGAAGKSGMPVAGPGADAGTADFLPAFPIGASCETDATGLLDAIEYVIIRAANNAAASGFLPESLALSLLFCADRTPDEVKRTAETAKRIADKEKLTISGGHTAFSDKISADVFSAFVTGRRLYERSGKTTEKLDIVMTGTAGIEGTAMLARAKRKELLLRFSPSFIDTAAAFSDRISSGSVSLTAYAAGGAYVHDLSEGGVFAGLWDLAEYLSCGLSIELRKIPLRQETVEICEYFGANPYEIFSSGALLIAAGDGKRMAEDLKKAGFEAVVIGHTTKGNDRVLFHQDERRFLTRPGQDGIYPLL